MFSAKETHSTRQCCRPLSWLKSTEKHDVEGSQAFPLASVAFNDSPLSMKTRTVVEDFFQAMTASFQSMMEADGGKHGEKQDDPKKFDQHSSLDLSVGLDEEKSSKLSGFVQYYVDYCVDHLGSPLNDAEPSELLGWSIPLYSRDFDRVLPAPEVTPLSKGVTLACFNCGGDHTLAECLEPKDKKRITLARQKILDLKNSVGSAGRYHQVGKLSQLVPGMLTPELKKALGGRPELPLFIYKMRELGYPPGHLLAQTGNEGAMSLAVYGEPEKAPERFDLHDDSEDVFPFKYPGFNSAVPEGVEDRSHALGLMPMSRFDVEHAKASLKTGGNRKRGKDESAASVLPRRKRPKLMPMPAPFPIVIDLTNVSDSPPEDGQLPDSPRDQDSSSVTKTSSAVASGGGDEKPDEKDEEYCPSTNWSLDFPPGRVDVTGESQRGLWVTIQSILKGRQEKR